MIRTRSLPMLVVAALVLAALVSTAPAQEPIKAAARTTPAREPPSIQLWSFVFGRCSGCFIRKNSTAATTPRAAVSGQVPAGTASA